MLCYNYICITLIIVIIIFLYYYHFIVKKIKKIKLSAGFSLKPANKVSAVNYVKMYLVYDRTMVRFSHVFAIIANVQ